VQTSGVYTYLGCYTEGAGMRALQGEFFPDDSNTVERCTANCYPFQYAGLEYGRECWCGDTIEGGASSVQNLQCGMACAGNSGEICGDSNRLSIYQ
ncbi:carbohydrate-binding WSC, partial [Mollisia scopiformis]